MRQNFLRAYIGIVCGAALLTVAASLQVKTPEIVWTWWGAAIIFIGAVVGEFAAVPLPKSGYVSVATMAHICGALLLPPPLAATVAAVAMVVVQVRERARPSQVIFNVSTTALTVGLVALLADRLDLNGTNLGAGDWVQVLAFFLVAATYYAVNDMLVIGVVAIATGERFERLLLANVRYSAPAELGVAIIGGLLALVWVQVPFWLPAALFPAVISQLTFQYIHASARRASQLATLDALGRAVAATVTPRELLGAIEQRLGEFGAADGAFLWLAKGGADVASGRAEGEAEAPMRHRLAARAMAQGAPVLLRESGLGPAGETRPQEATWLAVPLRAGTETLGCLGLVSKKTSAFGRDSIHFFGLVADRVALALENTRLFAQAAEAEARAELDRLKDELISVVSHELRTPLTSLVGFSELLLMQEFPEPERRKMLTIVNDEGRRLTNLLNDFLDLQRMERGKQSLETAPTDLIALVERAVAIAGPDSSRPILVDVPANLPPAQADTDRILQVLANLLSNARKYSPAGGAVHLAVKIADDGLEVTVRDRGLGIPPEALPRLFEKFYRVDHRDRRGISGTGLGLAICRMIVEAHGGRIWAESAGSGRGTVFRFTLPLATVTASPADAPAGPSELPALAAV